MKRHVLWAALALLAFAVLVPAAVGHPDSGDDGSGGQLHRHDPSGPLAEHDAAVDGIVSSGPSAKVTKNLAAAGRGERVARDATTDVWVHDGFAYIGTFNNPCGDGTGANGSGVHVFDVKNNNKPTKVGQIPSVEGSRINDVKVASLNSGDVLVHSNESCAGGPGGFEIYDAGDPANPVHLSSVRIDELNPISNALFGGLTDLGVHNLFLFSQGERDYVSAVSEGAFDNFRTYDITDPSNPVQVNAWGAEELFDPGVGDETTDVGRVLAAALWLLDGYGSSANRFLHDITVSADGTKAYLSNWDAGLVLLDLSDISSPQVVSVALDPANGSLDGEVNSHAAWPTADGKVVVETEEDFASWVTIQAPGNFTFGDADPDAPIPGSAISTSAGDAIEASPTGNSGSVDADSLDVTGGPLAGTTFPAVELTGDQPKFSDVGAVSGDIVFIGRACNGDPIENASVIADGGIAVVRRGACSFRQKNFNAAAAGADAVVIANNLRNDTPWGGVRIWDYSDPANPVLASTFDTTCSASAAPTAACDPRGTYSVHNVIVEGDKAYISWYSDGVLVLDISDPYNPVEVGRYHRAGADFEAENGGIQDVWGIYKVENRPWIYASDRNGGLYVLKEFGSGSAREGQTG